MSLTSLYEAVTLSVVNTLHLTALLFYLPLHAHSILLLKRRNRPGLTIIIIDPAVRTILRQC